MVALQLCLSVTLYGCITTCCVQASVCGTLVYLMLQLRDGLHRGPLTPLVTPLAETIIVAHVVTILLAYANNQGLRSIYVQLAIKIYTVRCCTQLWQDRPTDACVFRQWQTATERGQRADTFKRLRPAQTSSPIASHSWVHMHTSLVL